MKKTMQSKILLGMIFVSMISIDAVTHTYKRGGSTTGSKSGGKFSATTTTEKGKSFTTSGQVNPATKGVNSHTTTASGKTISGRQSSNVNGHSSTRQTGGNTVTSSNGTHTKTNASGTSTTTNSQIRANLSAEKSAMSGSPASKMAGMRSRMQGSSTGGSSYSGGSTSGSSGGIGSVGKSALLAGKSVSDSSTGMGGTGLGAMAYGESQESQDSGDSSSQGNGETQTEKDQDALFNADVTSMQGVQVGSNVKAPGTPGAPGQQQSLGQQIGQQIGQQMGQPSGPQQSGPQQSAPQQGGQSQQ